MRVFVVVCVKCILCFLRSCLSLRSSSSMALWLLRSHASSLLNLPLSVHDPTHHKQTQTHARQSQQQQGEQSGAASAIPRALLIMSGHEVQDSFPRYHGLTDYEWYAMRHACEAGDLHELVHVLGNKGADFCARAEGRVTLRVLTCIACAKLNKRIVSYLVTKRNVPLNTIPEDELALDMGNPDRLKQNRKMTPFQATFYRNNEDFALFLLSLRPGNGSYPMTVLTKIRMAGRWI